MSDGFAQAPCVGCDALFSFDPVQVPWVGVNGIREPVCRICVEQANPVRIHNGLEPIPILPGAYDNTQRPLTHKRRAARSATRVRTPFALSIQPSAYAPVETCPLCNTQGHHSGSPFHTWHEQGRYFLAVYGAGGYVICDDRSYCYGQWPDLPDFRKRYARGDLSVFIGNAVVTAFEVRTFQCTPYVLRAQRAVTASPRFKSIPVTRQLAVLRYIHAHAFDWERDGVSLEATTERGLQDVLETT